MAVYLHLFLKIKEATMINILLTLLKITNIMANLLEAKH